MKSPPRLPNFPPELSQRKMEELLTGGQELIQLVFAQFGELETVDLTDGLRMTFEDGDVIHVRPSGNAPELRCYTEADTHDRAISLLYSTLSILDSWRRRSQLTTYPYQQ